MNHYFHWSHFSLIFDPFFTILHGFCFKTAQNKPKLRPRGYCSTLPILMIRG